MTQYINKFALVAELEKKIKETKSMQPKFDQFWAGQISAFKGVLKILDTLEVKEVDTWHLQEKEDIYDAVKDWSLYSFICLMDDGSIQKFTGIYSECADGSINTHIDTIDDKYSVDNIIFWIETPL